MEKTLLALKTVITFNQKGSATIEELNKQEIEFLENEIKKFAAQQTKNCIDINFFKNTEEKTVQVDWDRY